MKLRDPGPPLTIDDLEAFEEEIGGNLPDDYKQFLLKHNGGWTNPPAGFRWNGEIHEVPDFLTLLPNPDKRLRRALRNLRELDIDGYLPITSNMNDDDICLDFRDKIGAVWFAIYSRDCGIPVEATMVPLASSFTEFLDKLFPIPEVYCPIEELAQKGTPEELTGFLAEGNSIDAKGKHDETILLRAISHANAPLVQASIEHGADLSCALHRAISRPDIIKMLVEAGADVNERNEYGKPPLRYVLGTALPGEEGARNREVRDLLISLGAVE